MEPTSRRSILGALGLGAVGLSTEVLAEETGPINGKDWPMWCPAMTKRSPEYQDKVAAALESLARSIRNRDALAVKVVANSMTTGEDFLQHDVTVTLELPAIQSEVRAPEQIRRAEEMFHEARIKLEAARAEAEQIVEQAMIQKAKAAEMMREAEYLQRREGLVLVKQDDGRWAWVPPVPPTGD